MRRTTDRAALSADTRTHIETHADVGAGGNHAVTCALSPSRGRALFMP